MPRLKPNIANFPDLIVDLNRILEGYDQELKVVPRTNKYGDLDMKGRRIMRVGTTKARDDVPGRKELERKGLYETPDGKHVAHSDMLVSGGIRTTRRAHAPDELVPLRQVQDMVGTGGGSGDAVVTSALDQIIAGHKVFRGLSLSAVAVSAINGINAAITISNSPTAPLGAFVYVTGPTAAYSVAGIRRDALAEGGFNGQLIVVFNSTNFPLTLLHESTGASAANRIRCPQSTTSSTTGMSVRRYGSVTLVYVTLLNRWVAASFA